MRWTTRSTEKATHRGRHNRCDGFRRGRAAFGNVRGDNELHVEARWTFAGHNENDRQPRNRVVDRTVATLYAARARAEATEYNRNGYFERARYVLTATPKRIRSYAGDDAQLNRIADELLRDLEMFEAPMTLGERKVAFYGAMASVGSRDSLGRARRAPPG